MKARSKYDIQIVNRKGKVYWRALPITVFEPTEAQLKARAKFAELAGLSRGKKGLDPIAKRPHASVSVELMRGETFEPHKEKHTVLEERLKEWIKTVLTLSEEERALLFQKIKSYK
jgi:hypothetical protein